jgi:hypothetical protein
MLADDGNRLSGSDVIARLPVIFAGGVELFRDELLAMRETKGPNISRIGLNRFAVRIRSTSGSETRRSI